MTKLVIPKIFRETAKRCAGKSSLGKKDPITGVYKYITYKDLEKKVDAFSSAFLELGVKQGDKVALMSENSPEWVITDLSLVCIGALNVPVYTTLTYQQLEYILNNCGAKGIVVSGNSYYQKVVKIFDSVPTLEFVIHLDQVEKVEHERVKTISFPEILALGQNNLEKNKPEIEKISDSLSEDELCSIIYTSGTTGDPKGVVLTHKNFMSNAKEAAKILLREVEDELELSFLPLSHSLERVVYYALVVVGGKTVAYAESIEAITKNLAEVRPTVMVSVPRIFEKIYTKVMDGVHHAPPLRQKIFKWALKVGKEYHDSVINGQPISFVLESEYRLADKLVFSKIKEKTGGNIKIFVSGGAPLMREIAEFFAYIGLPILEGYGLTESSPVITFNRPNNYKFGAVGQPIPGVEVRIAEDGEILARGPNIMKGYYNNHEATAEAIDMDGWLHTGDIGELDSENFLKITDRKKEIIVMSNGKNVAPQPIESILKTSKYIEQVALIGDNKKYISALIVPNFDNLFIKAKEMGLPPKKEELCKNKSICEFMRKEIDTVTADKIARFEQIKKFVLLKEEFTLERNEITPTLKLRRKMIGQNYKEFIDSMYENELSHSS
jgi:long-chain acyl-CoA synthetase